MEGTLKGCATPRRAQRRVCLRSRTRNAARQRVRVSVICSAAGVRPLHEAGRVNLCGRREILLPAAVSNNRNFQIDTTPTPWWRARFEPANVHLVENGLEELSRALSNALQNKKVCVIEFFAGWCYACRSLAPKIIQLASTDFAGVQFIKCRIGEGPEYNALREVHEIDRLPLFDIYRQEEGRVHRRSATLSHKSLQSLKRVIQQYAIEMKAVSDIQPQAPAAAAAAHKAGALAASQQQVVDATS